MTKSESILLNFLECLRQCNEDERAFYLSCLYKHLSEHPELMGEDTQAQQVADETGERYSDVFEFHTIDHSKTHMDYPEGYFAFEDVRRDHIDPDELFFKMWITRLKAMRDGTIEQFRKKIRRKP